VAGGPICDEDQSFFASVQMEEESDVGQKPGHSVEATERLIGAVKLNSFNCNSGTAGNGGGMNARTISPATELVT